MNIQTKRAMKAVSGKLMVSFFVISACAVSYAAWTAWTDTAGIRNVASWTLLTSAGWNLLVGNVENLNERVSSIEGTSPWTNIPLSDTADYDITCEYRYYSTLQHDSNEAWMNSLTVSSKWTSLSPKYLATALSAGDMFGIPSTNKSQYGSRNTSGVFSASSNITITKMERRCD